MTTVVDDLVSRVRFDANGLAPAIVREAGSGRVLMLAYVNGESLTRTIESGQTWFWSRSRRELWNKGAASGNRQTVVGIALDCDADALLIDVEAAGPACHRGTVSCFENIATPDGGHAASRRGGLRELELTLQQRRRDLPEGSYSAYLFNSGVDKILKKIGEEASEVIIAAKGESKERLVSEVADLMFHMTALLVNEGVSLQEVEEELDARATRKEGSPE